MALTATHSSHLRDEHFRCGLGRFATGVTVVTYFERAERRGFTVNSFTSVSMDPPLVLVSVARSARAHDELHGRTFVVNVLGAEQAELAMHFAGKPRLEPPWVTCDDTDSSPPRLAGALAHFQCAPWAAYNGGDHTLFLGEVTDFDYRSGDLLGFSGGRFVTIPEPVFGIEDLF